MPFAASPMPNPLSAGLRKLRVSGWSSLALGPMLLAGLLLLAVWGNTLARIDHEEQIAISSILTDNANVARIIAANLNEVLGKTNFYADLASGIANGQLHGRNELKPALFGDRAFLRLVVFDNRGQLLFSSARSRQEPALAALLPGDEAALAQPGLRIGHPDPSSGDAWRVPLLLPLGDLNRQGYLGAYLDLGYFLKIYQELDLGRSGRIEIIGDDGYQLIESSGGGISAGRHLGGSAYFTLLRQQPEGSAILRRPGESADSLVASKHLADYPFTVAIGRSRAEALAEHTTRRRRYLAEAGFLSVALLIATASLTLLARRQRRFFSASRQSEQDKAKLIEQLEAEKNHAYQQATHDHLTGLPNRLHFAELVSRHLAESRRSRQHSAIFFIDLDRFKQINDSLGHRVGDSLLCEVARRLRSCLRAADLAARFGGDEFVMLISNAHHIEDLGKVAKKIVDTVSQPCCKVDGHDLEVNLSLGIAVAGRDGADIETLLKRADTAMYAAKAAGRGTYRFFDAALNHHTGIQVSLAQHLHRALANDELRLHYQPRIGLSDFRLHSLEALVRWQHPEQGLVFPDDFIPLADENGLIIPLGHWVINVACQQLADWREQGLPPLPIAINLSPRQLRDDALVGTILAALARHDLPGSLLEIEITEGSISGEAKLVISRLERLHEHGLRIAMDDYGSGLSNLSLLKSLPIHALKIDRSLISDIHNHHSDAIIVHSTITLAHNLGFLVVAEGVETSEQLLHLKIAGCDEVQGYFFQRPAPADELHDLLQQGYWQKS